MVDLTIPRRPNGTMVLPGRIVREKVYEFDGSSVPTGVTAASGTATPAASTSGRGALGLATPASAAGACKLTLPNLDLAAVECVSLHVEGIRTPASGAPEGFTVELSASGLGAFMKREQNHTDGFPYMKYTGWASSTALPIIPFPAGRAESVDLALMLLPQRKLAYALVGDQIVGKAEYPDMGLGVITPAFSIITNTTVAKTASVARIRMVTRID